MVENSRLRSHYEEAADLLQQTQKSLVLEVEGVYHNEKQIVVEVRIVVYWSGLEQA